MPIDSCRRQPDDLTTFSGRGARCVLGVCIAALLAPATTASAGADQIDVTIREGTSMAAALSLDGTTVALDLLGSIWTMPVSGGEAQRLTDELSDARQPSWSPDGSRITFQAYRDGNWHIWSIGAGAGGLQQHTFGPFDDREPAWSHDGRRIAFASDRTGNYDIWELQVDSGQLRRITDDAANDFGPDWSPDDSEIAFASTRTPSGIWSVSAEGAERLLAEASGRLAASSWSPDGARLTFNVFEGVESRLQIVDTARRAPGEARPAATLSDPDEDVFPFRASWIGPDELLYTADGKLKRRQLESRAPSVVEFTAAVSFNRDDYERRAYDFDSTDAAPVRGILSPAVSPNGDRVVFTALGDLWTLDLGRESRPTPLTNDAYVELHPAWSPDGTLLVFASDRSGNMDLWLRDMRDGTERRLTDAPGVEAAPSWSPDGSHIAFVTDTGDMQTVNLATREVVTIRESLFRPGRPTWSRDGQWIALSALRRYSTRFREGRNEILLVSPDERTERYVTPFPHWSIGSRGTDGPVWSPDGRWMALVADGALWIVPVDDEGTPRDPPQRLTNEPAASLSWTADSRHLVFLGSDRLQKISIADGRIDDIDVALEWRRTHPAGRVVVHAGRLFDGRTDTLRLNVDLVLDGHRIRQVVAHDISLHAGRVIDASGATVMPGLIEMHTHQRDTYGEVLGRIWLAYGITSVREPAADPYVGLERRESIGTGRRLGPREFFTGATFDGSRIYYSGSLALQASGQVAGELERARRLGYDLIKTYVRLPDAVQRRVIEYAHQHGMPVTSHELYPAVASGADGVEHISGTSRRGYSPKVTALRHSYQDTIELLTSSGMTLTPTIGIMGGFGVMAADDPSMLDEPRFRRLFPATAQDGARARMARAQRDLTTARARLEPLGQTVFRVVDGGGTVIAGTDAPIVPYGLSLHTELQHFVDSGLTPAQALHTATWQAAAALGVGQDLGTLEPGKLADILIVDGNPLENIAHARAVRTVIVNGVVHELAELLEPRDRRPVAQGFSPARAAAGRSQR